MTFPSDAHLHLLLNHLPIVGTAFLTLLLLIGLVRRSRDVINVTLVLTIVMAAAAWPIQNTGEDAEEQVENAPWFSETRVHEHEEAAERATIALTVAAVLAAAALFRRRSQPDDRTVAGAAFAALAVAAVLYGLAGKAGALIRHSEEIDPAAPTGAAGPTLDRD